MKALIEYIEAGELDNAQLLQHYEKIEGHKAPMLFSMQRDENVRNTHIKYEIWVLLPDQEKEKYNEDLTPIGEKMPIVKVTEEESSQETSEDPSEEEASNEETESEESGEAMASQEQQLEEWKESLIIRRGELYRKMAVLSNNLVAASTDTERKSIIDQQDIIEQEMSKIETLLNETPKESKQQKFMTLERLQEMTPAGRQKYKEKITNQRSNNRKKLAENPNHANAGKWKADIDAITETIELINNL